MFMMESLNQSLFLWINATPDSPAWLLSLATFIAQDLLLIVPVLSIIFWLWGAQGEMPARRQVIIKVAIAIVTGLLLSWLISKVYPHDRPFVQGLGYAFLDHKPTFSFPSNHGTIIFTFALGFLFWHRLWSGLVLLAVGLAIAWSRIYLGVHWPLDMVGAFLVAIVSCGIAQLIWSACGPQLYQPIERLYRILFSPLIKRGWVRD